MVQLISNKQDKFNNWIAGVIGRLDELTVTQAMIIVQTTDDDNYRIIERMNCSSDDMLMFGNIIQKEAIKEDILMELEMDDYDDYDDEDYYEDLEDE